MVKLANRRNKLRRVLQGALTQVKVAKNAQPRHRNVENRRSAEMMSSVGPTSHFAARQFGRFRKEAEIKLQAGLAGLESDAEPKSSSEVDTGRVSQGFARAEFHGACMPRQKQIPLIHVKSVETWRGTIRCETKERRRVNDACDHPW
jgi:hypothetical protein